MTIVPITDGRREGHVKPADTGIMQPEDKKHLEPPEVGKARKDSPLDFSEETWPF